MIGVQILYALLLLYPGPQSRCIELRFQSIAASAMESEQLYGVPVEVFLATSFLETHLGCDPGSGGGFGAPISRSDRHTAGTAASHGSALALGLRQCGTAHGWLAAVSHYRTGRCRWPVTYPGYTAVYAIHLANRIRERATHGIRVYFNSEGRTELEADTSLPSLALRRSRAR